MNQEKIGKFIAKQRKEKNLTQEELADRLKVNSKSISRWENSKCMPDLSLLIPLSKELDITLNDLLSGEKINNKDYQETFETNILKVMTRVDKTNKRYKILLRVIIIILVILPILSCVFCMIDYNRVKDGKEPIFNYYGFSINNNDFCLVQNGDCTLEMKSDISATYYGLGYKIIDCEYCKNKVYPMFLGFGTLPFERLVCKNDQDSYEYYFMDGKIAGIYTKFNISAKDIKDIESYENEIKIFNTINNCYGAFTKNYDTSYSLEKNCYLKEMSETDIQSVYGNDSFKRLLSRKELTKWYKKNNESIKCELIN